MSPAVFQKHIRSRWGGRHSANPRPKNSASPNEPKPKVVLLEHDRRFAVFPEFIFYDFAQPLKLPRQYPPSPIKHIPL